MNVAIEEAKRLVGDALQRGGSVVAALLRARKILSLVPLDRSRVKPKVSVIGEFWAMTTEGDGNYHLYEFLEEQGAEYQILLRGDHNVANVHTRAGASTVLHVVAVAIVDRLTAAPFRCPVILRA